MEVTTKYDHRNFNQNVESIKKVQKLCLYKDTHVATVFSICIKRKSEVRNGGFTSTIVNFYPFLASF